MSFLPGMSAVAGAFVNADAPDATITFTDSSVSTPDQTTHTFASQSFGAAAVGDHIIVCIAGRAVNPRTATVTIDGQAATQVAYIDNLAASGNNHAGIYIAPALGNASGTVAVTYNAQVLRCGIGVHVAKNLLDATATDADTDSGASPSVSIDVVAGGIAAAVLFSAEASTWTGLSETYDEAIESGNTHSGASAAFAAVQSGLTISNGTTQAVAAFAAASFR